MRNAGLVNYLYACSLIQTLPVYMQVRRGLPEWWVSLHTQISLLVAHTSHVLQKE